MRRFVTALLLALAATFVVPAVHADATAAYTQFTRVSGPCTFTFIYWRNGSDFPTASAKASSQPAGYHCNLNRIEVLTNVGREGAIGAPFTDTVWHSAVDNNTTHTLQGAEWEYESVEVATGCIGRVGLYANPNDFSSNGAIGYYQFIGC